MTQGLFIYNTKSVFTGSQMKGSSSHFCLLIEKPDGCPQESFDKLHEVFQGDLCDGYAITKVLDCPFICPALFRPVCGSDGKTYINQCRMRKASCQNRLDLVMVHEGRCRDHTGKDKRLYQVQNINNK